MNSVKTIERIRAMIAAGHSFAFIARRFNEARSSPDETERPWTADDVAEVCRTLERERATA